MARPQRIAAFVLASIFTLALTGCWHRHHHDDYPPPPPPGDHHDGPPPDHGPPPGM